VGDEEKTQKAHALNALHLNIGGALVFLGIIGLLFFFEEKIITSLLLLIGVGAVIVGMILSRRGEVVAGGAVLLIFIWLLTIVMALVSGGIRSLDILFFISGTVIAGIVFGARGAYFYAGLSLVTGLFLIWISGLGIEFPQLFTFPPFSAWMILFINLIFTVIPLQVALNSLRVTAKQAQVNEERYRLITSVMSDYAFSVKFSKDGDVLDQWLSGPFEEITGYTPDEYFAHGGWVSILHPDDAGQDAKDMAQLHMNRNVVSEIKIIRKDGGIRWVRSYGHPLWSEEENRLVGIYGAVQDITGQKHAEESVQQRAEEISLLYRLSLALSSEQDLYLALRAFEKELKQVVPLDAFHVGLYDQVNDIFSYSLFLNLGEDLQPQPRSLKETPGLTWDVISKRKTLYIPDLTDPETQRKHTILWVVDAPIRSYVGIPLMLQDHVIGVMSAQSVQVSAYDEEQIPLLETIATQVAITIEKLSLFERSQDELAERKKAEAELRKRENILEVVAEAANVFLKVSEWRPQAWNLEVNNLLKKLGTTINASHAYIFENDHQKDGSVLMSMRYEWTAPDFLTELDDPKYKNMSIEDEYMANWNQNVFYGSPYIGDDAHASQDDMQSLKSRGIYALLDVPIYVDDVWWGTIGFDDMAQPRIWTNAEVGALVVASNLLGAVIKRVQLDSMLKDELNQRVTLINELEKRNAESETLRESAAIVVASLERAETFSLILDQMARVVPYSSASIQLIDGEFLEIVGARDVDMDGDNVQLRFLIDENEPAYPVLMGGMPYILYNDVQISISAFNDIPHDHIHAWMAVPLKVKGKILGIIALDGKQVGQFSERDAELAVTYANQVAIALENSRLFSELQLELGVRQKLIHELEDKNAELERFTYTVSHDLRSPLVTIRGFLGYLEKDAKNGNMTSFMKDLNRISSATLRMDELLKDVLELSRIGRLVNRPQDVSFNDLVDAAIEAVHGRIEARGITLQTQPDLPLVHVDRLRLIEVLQNLIDNAAKYMGDQSEPYIEVGIDGYDDSGRPVFFVRDNGMGIAPEYHETIFGLFNKLDATSEGTGIGLALVKRIIEFHECSIWLESELGKGSVFYFTLPNTRT